MKSLKTLRSLLIGLLLICLGSVAFMGCTDSQDLSSLVTTSNLTGAIATPKAAPAGTTMAITPTDANGNPTGAAVQVPVASISDGLKLETPAGVTATATAGTPAIVVEVLNGFGQQVGVSAPISLTAISTGLATGAIQIPVNAGGSYRIALAPGTTIQFGTAAALTRGDVPNGLTIGNVNIAFDINFDNTGKPLSTTIPADWTLTLTKSGSKFKLASSTMTVFWNALNGSVAPTGSKAAELTLKMYDGATSVGTAVQAVDVISSAAKFTGKSAAGFTKVDIDLDVTNK